LTAPRRPDFSALAATRPPVPEPSPAFPASRPDEKPGVIDEFVGMLGDKAKEMARTALETVSAALKQNIETGVPKLVDEAASRLAEPGAREPTFASRFDDRRSPV
jgi:hypothetical protein